MKSSGMWKMCFFHLGTVKTSSNAMQCLRAMGYWMKADKTLQPSLKEWNVRTLHSIWNLLTWRLWFSCNYPRLSCLLANWSKHPVKCELLSPETMRLKKPGDTSITSPGPAICGLSKRAHIQYLLFPFMEKVRDCIKPKSLAIWVLKATWNRLEKLKTILTLKLSALWRFLHILLYYRHLWNINSKRASRNL